MSRHTEVMAIRSEMIARLARELTAKDEALVHITRQLVIDRYEKDKHHLAACAWGKFQAEHYSSVQLNCKRAREASICAEAGCIHDAAMKRDELVTIVTFHANHDDPSKPYVVPPCALCVTRFQRFAEDCEVIVDIDDKRVKVPQSALMLLHYPKLNGSGAQVE